MEKVEIGQAEQRRANMLESELQGILIRTLNSGIEQAYSAARALIHLRSTDQTDPDIVDGTNIVEKAREQAISLIVDSQDESSGPDKPDDNGEHVGNVLQSVLMIAVMVKSDILDHLDSPVERGEVPAPVISPKTGNPPIGSLAHKLVKVFEEKEFGHFMTIEQLRGAIKPQPVTGALVAMLGLSKRLVNTSANPPYRVIMDTRYGDGTSPKGGRKVKLSGDVDDSDMSLEEEILREIANHIPSVKAYIKIICHEGNEPTLIGYRDWSRLIGINQF